MKRLSSRSSVALLVSLGAAPALLVLAFTTTPNIMNNNCRVHNSCSQLSTRSSAIESSTKSKLQLQLSESPLSKKNGFRLKTSLFAAPKESEDIEEEEEEDDDLELDGEDEEEEEVDVEIGIDEDEEESEEDIEYEYEELEEEEEYDEEYEYEDEGEGDQEQLEEETTPANADIWASYDAANEEPPTPLLEDLPSDPNYQLAKESVLTEVTERKAMREAEAKVPRTFESVESVTKTMDYIMNGMTDEERDELENNDVDLAEVEKIIGENQLTEDDLKDIIIEEEGEDGYATIDPQAIAEAGSFRDDQGLDAFPSSTVEEDGENLVYPSNGAFTEKDLVELDGKIAAYKAARQSLKDQTYFGEEHTFAYLDVEKDWPALSNETQDEILDVIENSNTMACPEPEMWLMYDLKFNVTNLILASFKHNAEAPIMFTQWMPQLEVYERYADERAMNFEWTWDDVENADMEELQRYYKGIGYDAIPKKDAGETGVITLDESPLDDEEREMLALENWMDEVYNEESDNLLFDDESFEPRDNVFDPDYGTSEGSKSAALEEKFMKEYDAFEREFSGEDQEWRDQFATVEKFEYRDDPEGQKEFRGHLVVACTQSDEDMEIAEDITVRIKKEFGKAVFVETRVLGHARAEDQVFEVWLESFETDLLHSKRQAFINSKLWTGPSDVDAKQLDYIVDKVRYLISDDARYSYRMSDYSDVSL